MPAHDTLIRTVSSPPLNRPRIRRIPREIAAALEHLFRDRDMVVLEGNPSTMWRFNTAVSLEQPAVLLRGSQTELALGLSEDGLHERLGEREWWDYEGQPRTLAWTLAHHRLIEDLSQLLGEPLMPDGFAGEGDQPAADSLTALTLGFSVASSDGRQAAGTLRLPSSLVSRLASHPGWKRDPLGAPWSQLPARLRIELQGLPFPLSELRAAEIGDVLVLGRSHCLQALTVVATAPRSDTPLRLWGAAASSEGVIIRSDASRPAPRSQPNSLEQLPLDFALATVSAPLAEFASFKPGYVLKLPGSLMGARAEIRVRHTLIGYGELLMAGDVLGMQLLGIDAALRTKSDTVGHDLT